ncbi:MAG: mannose-1-phosphate guanylyltransferase [Myxococcota bacterium]|nr:mannose-1-phosphate guanylyltransferase [Myxococcota bacterium]
MTTFAVIMAGGAGTRFWPLSRRLRPKQLLSLLTERSLLVETIMRIAPSTVAHNRTLIVTGTHLKQSIDALVSDLGVRVIAEPMARNTAPCLGLAAAHVAHTDPTAVMAVLPADQFIRDVDTYRRVFHQAVTLAETGRIVTLGIRPTRPETGYGYIRRGGALDPTKIAYAVDAFVEKPDASTANRYLQDGRYDWNSGMFFLRADVALEAIRTHLPKLHDGLIDYRSALGTTDEKEALVRCFEHTEATSIDYGIMEKETDRVAVIPADIGWSDVGSWYTLLEFRESGQSNFTRGDVRVTESKDSVVISDGPFVAVHGVEGLSVVATADSVLVTPVDKAQDVGAIAKHLQIERKDLA